MINIIRISSTDSLESTKAPQARQAAARRDPLLQDEAQE